MRDRLYRDLGLGLQGADLLRRHDTIHVVYTIEDLRVTRSNPERAVLTYAVEVGNQRGDVVQSGHKALMVSTGVVASIEEGASGDE